MTESRPAETPWQPMESAPRDGTWIEACGPTHRVFRVQCRKAEFETKLEFETAKVVGACGADRMVWVCEDGRSLIPILWRPIVEDASDRHELRTLEQQSICPDGLGICDSGCEKNCRRALERDGLLAPRTSKTQLDELKKYHAETVECDGGKCEAMMLTRWAINEIERLQLNVKMRPAPTADCECGTCFAIRQLNKGVAGETVPQSSKERFGLSVDRIWVWNQGGETRAQAGPRPCNEACEYMRVLSRREIEKLAGDGVDVQQFINSLLRTTDGQRQQISALRKNIEQLQRERDVARASTERRT
jgi:hypothetical protein